MPAMGDDGFFTYATENAQFTFSGMGLVSDVACAVGMIGLFLTIFFLIARDKPLVPLKDPRLGEALNYHNP